ncbi:hypothetical protein ACFL1Q_02935 [Patescibacteria group bacterium]
MGLKAGKIAKWVGISGSWAITTKEVERDVRKVVRKVVEKGGGIVTGGALNVDSFATDEAIKIDPQCKHLKIFLPATLKLYSAHYRKRAKEGVITEKQAEDLISQLEYVYEMNPKAIIENKINTIVDKTTYFERNSEVVKASDELFTFHVEESIGGGTIDTAEKARKSGIPVRMFNYKSKK